MPENYKRNGYSDFSVSTLLKAEPRHVDSTNSEAVNSSCKSKDQSWLDGFRQITDSKTRVSTHCLLSNKAQCATQMQSIVVPQEPVCINSVPLIQLPGTHLTSSIVWPPCSWIWLASQTNATSLDESDLHFSSDDCLSPLNYSDSRYIRGNTNQKLTMTPRLQQFVQAHILQTDTNRNTPLRLPNSTSLTYFPPPETSRSVDPSLGKYSTFNWVDSSLTNTGLFGSSSKLKELGDVFPFARNDFNALHQRLLPSTLTPQVETMMTPTQSTWLTQPAVKVLVNSGSNITNEISLLSNQSQSDRTSLYGTTKPSRGHFDTFTVSRRRGGILRRAVFSESQREGLETAFDQHAYITKPDRRILAEKLGLKDSQVKIWFQNRRMKWRSHGQHNASKSSQFVKSKLMSVHEPLQGKVNGRTEVNSTGFTNEKKHTVIERQSETPYAIASLDRKQDDFSRSIKNILECPIDTPMKVTDSSNMAEPLDSPDIAQTNFCKFDSDLPKSHRAITTVSRISQSKGLYQPA